MTSTRPLFFSRHQMQHTHHGTHIPLQCDGSSSGAYAAEEDVPRWLPSEYDHIARRTVSHRKDFTLYNRKGEAMKRRKTCPKGFHPIVRTFDGGYRRAVCVSSPRESRSLYYRPPQKPGQRPPRQPRQPRPTRSPKRCEEGREVVPGTRRCRYTAETLFQRRLNKACSTPFFTRVPLPDGRRTKCFPKVRGGEEHGPPLGATYHASPASYHTSPVSQSYDPSIELSLGSNPLLRPTPAMQSALVSAIKQMAQSKKKMKNTTAFIPRRSTRLAQQPF